MVFEHGKKQYSIILFLFVFNECNKISTIKFYDIESFKSSMELNYPDINIDLYLNFVNSRIDDIRNWIDMGKSYNPKWESLYLYAGIVGNELLYSEIGTLLSSRMCEKQKRLDSIKNDFICNIECYGWTVNHIDGTSMKKITYYTTTDKSESNPQKYMIYAYKDYVVLGNADINKPSIISGKYFLYNGGKKSDG